MLLTVQSRVRHPTIDHPAQAPTSVLQDHVLDRPNCIGEDTRMSLGHLRSHNPLILHTVHVLGRIHPVHQV